MELKFRDLRAEEIECRVGNTKRQNPKLPKSDSNPVVGFQILLYKNARVDANILDETVGAFNWTKKFYQVKNTMFCEVAIRDKDTGEWVAKSDCGDDDFQTEQVKGEASDSFKRACFAWSLGRMNLYYAPFIWLKCENGVDEFIKLYVSEVEYKDHIISKIIIKDRITDNVIYSYPKGAKVSQNAQNQGYNHSPKATPSDISKDYDNNMKKVRAFAESLPADKFTPFFNWLEKRYNTRIITQLTADQLIEVINLYKIKDIEE